MNVARFATLFLALYPHARLQAGFAARAANR